MSYRGINSNARKELLEEKAEVDEALSLLKVKFKSANQSFYQNRKTMPHDQYVKLKSEIASLQRRSLQLQASLGKEKQLTLPQIFMTVAEELLDDETFDKIMQAALGRKDGHK